MEYIIFVGFKKINTVYNSIEIAKTEAKKLNGIINICGIITVDGKIKIVNRTTFKNN